MAPPPPPDPDLPRFPGWVTIEKLGEGGMCEVYRARPAEGDGAERAIKVLMDRTDSAVRRFVDEAALLQRIDHPNVVRVHAIDAQARPPWLVMDLLGGRDLEDTIQVEGRMDPERAARVFADLASGLGAVHAIGVRHRDIKPANLRFGTDGVPRLIDFGIARDASAARQTRAGFVVGTAAYLPPEVYADEDAQAAQDSEAADVYALGQSLSEVLAGAATHALKRDGAEQSLMIRIMRDKLERDHLDPRESGAPVPEELAKVVMRATAREPEDRIQTASELERQLRAFLAERESVAEVAPLSRISFPEIAAPAPPPPPAPPPAPIVRAAPTPAPPPARRRGGWLAMSAVGAAGLFGSGALAVGALVLLVCGVFALWWFRPAPEAASPEDAVRAVVAGLDGAFVRCRDGAGRLSVALTVQDRRAQRADVRSSDVDKRVERCVVKVLTRADYPVDGPVTVEVPVQFR